MNNPGPKPPRPSGCTCGPWKITNGHWTKIIDPNCKTCVAS